MSFTSLNYHIVFSTKGRKPLLSNTHIEPLCRYIGGILRNNKGCLLASNGMPDHLHLAASLHPQTNLSDCLRDIKAGSSHWLRKEDAAMDKFGWQDGYSAFSVSYSGLEKVIAYIQGQQEHHKKLSFEEELIVLLKKHNIDYDPKYVFG